MAAPAFSADAKNASPVFASVDLIKVLDGYDKRKAKVQELMGLQTSMQMKLDLRDNNKLLSDEEFKQLADLKSVANPTADDQKKMNDIIAADRQREQEFQALQQKQTLNDTEKAQLREYSARMDRVASSLNSDKEKYDAELRKKGADLDRQTSEELDVAIASVAKEKGVGMVFSKTVGQVPFILYSNVDISDDVLKKLNKK